MLISDWRSDVCSADLDNAARIASGSNLAQPQVREADINEVFAGVETQAGNMDFKTHGRIILSRLERNADGGQQIHWQRCYSDLDGPSSHAEAGGGGGGAEFPRMDTRSGACWGSVGQ